jgi:hypothetical protein
MLGIRLCLNFITAYVPAEHKTEYELHLFSKIYNIYFQQIYTIPNLYLDNLNILYQILA